MTAKEKAKDRRLQKLYGWTLEMANNLLELQDHVCAGCGKPPKTVLALDHHHFKVEVVKSNYEGKKWHAFTNTNGLYFEGFANSKAEAMRIVKHNALPFSVRGYLCRGPHGIGCNTKLGRADHPEWLRHIADYLENPPARQILKEQND